jgi:hypothetical protein
MHNHHTVLSALSRNNLVADAGLTIKQPQHNRKARQTPPEPRIANDASQRAPTAPTRPARPRRAPTTTTTPARPHVPGSRTLIPQRLPRRNRPAQGTARRGSIKINTADHLRHATRYPAQTASLISTAPSVGCIQPGTRPTQIHAGRLVYWRKSLSN